MVNISELEGLLSSSCLHQIENSIANKKNCDIYKDDLSLLTEFKKKEVDASMLSLNEIEKFLENNKEKVINFGLKFLENINPQSLGIGIAISYSIYLIYLKEKSEKELLEYLKRRRIPNPQKLLEQLWNIKKEMSI